MLKYWNFFLPGQEAADEYEQPVWGLGQLPEALHTGVVKVMGGQIQRGDGGGRAGRRQAVGDRNEK